MNRDMTKEKKILAGKLDRKGGPECSWKDNVNWKLEVVDRICLAQERSSDGVLSTR
jgi:hypothetical protein